MARFKRLTDAEARHLSRRELLDRVEREQAYWYRKHRMSDADRQAEREFHRIMHAYLDPAAAIQDTLAWLEGRGAGGYWDTRPADDGQSSWWPR